MAQRQAAQQQSVAPFVIAAGVAAAGYGTWVHWPGLVAIWVAFVAAAWMEPPAILTGKKDASGFPTPAHSGEVKRLAASRFWGDAKWKLVLPGAAWLPGWPVFGSWVAAVIAAGVAAQLPTLEPSWRAANAAAVFITVTAIPAARRRTSAQGDSPGVRVDSLPEAIQNKVWLFAAVGVGVGAAAGTVYGLTAFAPAGTVDIVPLFAVTVGVLAALGVVASPWSTAALAHWRVVVAARAEWEPRWQALKIDPAPNLVDRQMVGDAQVDTFEASGGLPAMTYWPMAPKISPTVGAGARVAVLSVADEGPSGPVPGSRHPLRFQVVTWLDGNVTDPGDSGVPEEVVELVAHCGMAWGMDRIGYARPIPVAFERITTDESPGAVWRSSWANPDGPGWTDVRAVVGDIADGFGCGVLVDHRAEVLYFGRIGDPDMEWMPSDTGLDFATTLKRLDTEDHWNGIWGQVLKQTVNPPSIQHGTWSTQKLADGTEVHRAAWMVRLGFDPADFRGLEPKLATGIQNAPFVSIAGWPDKGDRPGERHPQAFVTYWSSSPVPSSPEKLAPSPAAEWVLTGRINQAFDAARLARPEIAMSDVLTKPDARAHIWRIMLRLYGGVTLADVRGHAGRIRQAMGASWLRVDAADDGCVLYIGTTPEKADLVNPRRDRRRLAALDWAQAWIDSGVTGVGGLVPTLTDMAVLPRNQSVQVIDFKLPPGVDPSKVNESLPKLRNATGNEFIEVRPGVEPSSTRLLVSTENPLPAMVPYDFEFVDPDGGIPFATGVEGEPICFRVEEAPHALLAGVTGAGKSFLAMMLLYGALAKGWKCYVIDPVKGGADFTFAKDRCVAFAGTPFEASGVMKEIYAEVVRRKNLNAEHGVGSYKDLPDDVRPPHIAVLIDEFTSLLGTTALPPKSDDLTMSAERDALEAENFARTEVGVFAGKLAREARSAGVTLLLGTQKLTAKMLDSVPGASDLRSNLARTLLGKASSGDMMSALRAPFDAPKIVGDIGKGRGLWEPVTSAAQIIQVWYADQAELRAALEARVPALSDAERLDLTKFVGPASAPVHHPSASDGPVVDEVIDVGEMTLSLDDLLVAAEEIGEKEGVAPEAVQVPSAPPVTVPVVDVSGVPSPTVMFLDLDGVLSPLGPVGGTEWGGWVDVAGDGYGHLQLSTEMARELDRVDAVKVWLTSWREGANEFAAGKLGWERVEVLDWEGLDDEDGVDWWKCGAARRWLAAHPEITSVVWFDDDLSGPAPSGETVLDDVFGLLLGDGFPPDRLLMKAPDSGVGLTREDVAEAVKFSGDAAFTGGVPSVPELLSPGDGGSPVEVVEAVQSAGDGSEVVDASVEVAVTEPAVSWAPPPASGENYEDF